MRASAIVRGGEFPVSRGVVRGGIGQVDYLSDTESDSIQLFHVGRVEDVRKLLVGKKRVIDITMKVLAQKEGIWERDGSAVD